QRAGSTTTFFFGDDPRWLLSYAHVNARQSAPGAGKLPNRWGLFDLVGNVWELCWDWEAPVPTGVLFDPTGPSAGARTVARGGAFDSGSYATGPGFRLPAVGRWPSRGFRVVCAAGTEQDSSFPARLRHQIDACRQALALLPDHLDLYRARGDLLVRAGRWTEAAADLQQ